MSKRRIQIRELQKQELHQKVERILLIRLHIFYLILLINLYTKNEMKERIVNNKILQNPIKIRQNIWPWGTNNIIAKTNNQELLIRREKESDATSKCIDFQNTPEVNNRGQGKKKINIK